VVSFRLRPHCFWNLAPDIICVRGWVGPRPELSAFRKTEQEDRPLTDSPPVPTFAYLLSIPTELPCLYSVRGRKEGKVTGELVRAYTGVRIRGIPSNFVQPSQ
jgi:hypothetical protein